MENKKINFGRYLYGILALELFFSLSLTFFPFSLFIRILVCLIAILGIVLYHKLFPKLDIASIVWILATIGYLLTISIFYKEAGLNIPNILALIFSALGSVIIGYLFSANEDFKNYPIISLYLSMIVFGIINLFYTLFQFGFFYVATRGGTVTNLAKLLVGLSFENIDVSVLGYLLVLLSSGLGALWCYKSPKKDRLFYIALISGVLGVCGLISLPYWQGALAFFIALGAILLIHFYPKKTKHRIIYLSAISVVLIGGFLFIIVKSQNIPRVQMALDILKNIFKYPLGQSLTTNSKNIFLDAAYQGGIIPFLFLIILWVIMFHQLYRYYRYADDSKLVKECLLSLIICYFVYVNLNYEQKIFLNYDDLMPCFMDPMLLIVMIIYGYMKGKNPQKEIGDEHPMMEGEKI